MRRACQQLGATEQPRHETRAHVVKSQCNARGAVPPRSALFAHEPPKPNSAPCSACSVFLTLRPWYRIAHSILHSAFPFIPAHDPCCRTRLLSEQISHLRLCGGQRLGSCGRSVRERWSTSMDWSDLPIDRACVVDSSPILLILHLCC